MKKKRKRYNQKIQKTNQIKKKKKEENDRRNHSLPSLRNVAPRHRAAISLSLSLDQSIDGLSVEVGFFVNFLKLGQKKN